MLNFANYLTQIKLFPEIVYWGVYLGLMMKRVLFSNVDLNQNKELKSFYNKLVLLF